MIPRLARRLVSPSIASLGLLFVTAARAQEPPPAPPPAPAAVPAAGVANALPPVSQTPAPPPPTSTPAVPFAWGDFTWMNGQSRQKDFPLGSIGNAVTPSLYLDVGYAFSSNHPKDHTLTGSASMGRHDEVGINLASIGLEWSYRNVIGRFSVQYGNMLNIVQDLDGTTARGRSLTAQNLRYVREATAGYHFDVGRGLNVEAGIFMSYIGLESYLLAENWNATRSLVCDHTPFYFSGIRLQYFPSDRLKIEPWLMNGWQSYGKWNQAPSAGMAFRYNPTESVALIANFYGGTDTKNVAERVRFHHDDSLLVRYWNAPSSGFLSKAAFSLNTHVGFEAGGKLAGEALPGPREANMVGTSLVNRLWFARDKYALSIRGEVFSNQGRYLAQYPPPGLPTGGRDQPLRIYGVTGTFDVLPTDFLALRTEASYRRANVGYFAGPEGTTSPDGFQGTAGDFTPDTRKDQALFLASVNFRL